MNAVLTHFIDNLNPKTAFVASFTLETPLVKAEGIFDNSEKRFHAPETYIKIVITNRTTYNGHLFTKP